MAADSACISKCSERTPENGAPSPHWISPGRWSNRPGFALPRPITRKPTSTPGQDFLMFLTAYRQSLHGHPNATTSIWRANAASRFDVRVASPAAVAQSPEYPSLVAISNTCKVLVKSNLLQFSPRHLISASASALEMHTART